MQFELSPATPDSGAVTAVLRALDPGARVALDRRSSRLEVLASVSSSQVIEALQALGIDATLREQDAHVSGGRTCCGHCG